MVELLSPAQSSEDMQELFRNKKLVLHHLRRYENFPLLQWNSSLGAPSAVF